MKSGPRVLVISHDFKPTLGGEAEFAYALSSSLLDLGLPVRVLVPPCTNDVPEDQAFGGQIERKLHLEKFRSIKSPRGLFGWPIAMFALTRSIGNAAAAHRADLCLVTSHMTWIVLALDILRLDYMLVLHGEESTWMLNRGPVSRWLFLRTVKKARWLFFNSDFSRRRLLEVIPELADKTEVLGCGVRLLKPDSSQAGRLMARRRLGWEDEPVLVTVAQLVARKGVDTVIKAMPAILKRFPSCRYVVVGAGPEKDTLINLSSELNISEHVNFVGRVDDEQKNMIYAASDIYVMVSQSDEQGAEEGFGIVFLEANNHGLPVVASRCGGIVEAVEDGVNGVLVDQRAAEQVASAVTSLLLDPQMRFRLAEAGRERIQNKFNWPAIARRVAARLNAVREATKRK
jgi:phosphatidylinositol alpha-1,6-mannosyltransferase